MAKLYFRYGAMGSSKTANAIMVQYNYQESGQKALLVKPQLDNRDGDRIIVSRSGMKASCIFMEELTPNIAKDYDCIIVDEAQFLNIEEIKTICWCGKKATYNARIQNGKVIKDGDQIMLGGNESYVSLCRKHWEKGELGG